MYLFKDLKLLEVQDESLTKVLIALEGTWEGHVAGSFTITRNDIAQMKQNFDNQQIDVVADYEHQTILGEKAPASGWIKRMEAEEVEGASHLYAYIAWTDEASGMIRNREYRYVSPVLIPHTIDKKSGKDIGWSVHSISLTNVPFLEELGEVFINRVVMFDQIIELKAKVSRLEHELAGYATLRTEQKVDAAIAAGKLTPEQRESAIALYDKSPDQFDSFIQRLRPRIEIPPSNIFLAKDARATIGDETAYLNKVAAGIQDD